MAPDRALARYLRRQVHPYSDYYGPLLERAGFQLDRLPVVDLDAIDDSRALVLRPDADTIPRGEPLLAMRLMWSRLIARTEAFGRNVIDPSYKPIVWLLAEGFPLGYSAADLDRLAELGRQWLEAAGIRPDDVVVGFNPGTPTLAFWELSLATRRAGLSSLFLDPPADSDEVARLRPSVLVGEPAELIAVLEATGASGLATVLVVGDVLDGSDVDKVQSLVGEEVAVLRAWAPPGARSLWTQCRGGDGLHLSPGADIVEVVGGELVWSALDWYGTVLLRLRTGVSGSVVDGRCQACGRDGPRVRIDGVADARPPRFTSVLEAHPGVAVWQAELRTVDGEEELIVYLSPTAPGHPGALLRDLVNAMDVTQFVILDAAAVRRRISDHRGERVIDNRA